jgi:ankyrin repeat protein
LSKDQTIIQKLLYNRWPLYLSAVKGCKLLVKFLLEEKRKHQDMLMDKPESDIYVCNFDSDSESKSRSKYSFSKDDNRTIEGDAYQIVFENSPMVAACEGGYIDIVKCLVEHGYNINHSGTILPTPLFSACKYGKKDVVDYLLKKNCKVDAIDKIGQIALHAACENGNIDIVNILLKYNSSVNLCSTGGLAPLHFACICGHTDVVHILIDNKCDINSNKVVFYSAIHINYIDIIIEMSFDYNINLFNMILSDSDLSLQPIECACIKGHTDIVKLLLDNNCDVIDNNGFSLTLYSACKRGSVDIVDLLLRNKCNINQCRPGTNKSLLIVACDKRNRNQEAVAKMLLSYKACDVNITDCNNRNALHYACENGQADVVELLLRRHCNVNLNDKWMKTPLCIAFESGHVDIVKMFN